MVAVDGDDVSVVGHRPIGAELTLRAVVDRILPAQALEPGPKHIAAEEFGVGDVEFIERGCERFGARLPCLVACCAVHACSTPECGHETRTSLPYARPAFQARQVDGINWGSSCARRSEERKS